MVGERRAVAQPQPSKMDLIYGHLRTRVFKILSSTMENEAGLEGSKAVLQVILATCGAFEIQAPGIPSPNPLTVAGFDGDLHSLSQSASGPRITTAGS